jgi:sec-independent protein translocase protein TatB
MNMSELLFILVLLMVVVGPQRLPEYAESLARWVRQLRRVAMGAREQVRAELGPEFDDVDWTKLDPRQYDPRRIVKEALSDVWDAEPTKPVNSRVVQARGHGAAGEDLTAAQPVDPDLVSSQHAPDPTASPNRTDPVINRADEPARETHAAMAPRPRQSQPQTPAHEAAPVPFDLDAT